MTADVSVSVPTLLLAFWLGPWWALAAFTAVSVAYEVWLDTAHPNQPVVAWMDFGQRELGAVLVTGLLLVLR